MAGPYGIGGKALKLSLYPFLLSQNGIRASQQLIGCLHPMLLLLFRLCLFSLKYKVLCAEPTF
jgi:hypothetical protein